MTMIIGTGAAHKEGGFEAIAEKGEKAAIVQAVKEREDFDYSKMND